MSKNPVEFQITNEKLLVDYVKASIKAKEAKEKFEGMKNAVQERLDEDSTVDGEKVEYITIGVKVDGEVYVVRLQERDNYQYSEKVKIMEQELNDLKEMEVLNKTAKKLATTVFPVVNKK